MGILPATISSGVSAIGSLMPLCDADSRCFHILDKYNELGHMPNVNASFDTYISNTGCGNTLSNFGFVNGSCNSTDTQYMTCQGTDFNIDPLHQFTFVSADACKLIC